MESLSSQCIAEESASARSAYFAQRVLTLHGELSAAEASHIVVADLLLKWIRYHSLPYLHIQYSTVQYTLI